MTLLCAPVKQLTKTDAVELQELDIGTHKRVYQGEKLCYIDTDWNMTPYKGQVKSIVSYHNFKETPDLDYTLRAVQTRHPGADLYKIATFAHSTLDSLRMLEFLSRHK